MICIYVLAVLANPSLSRSSSSGSLDSFSSSSSLIPTIPNPDYVWYNPLSWRWFSPEKPVEELSGSLSRSSSFHVPEPVANQGIVGPWNQLPVRQSSISQNIQDSLSRSSSSGSLEDGLASLSRSSSSGSLEDGLVSLSRSPSSESLVSSLSNSGSLEHGLAGTDVAATTAKSIAQGPTLWSQYSPSAWWNWATKRTKDASIAVKDVKNGVDKGLNKEAIELWSRRAKYAVVGVAATAAAVGAYNIYKGMKKSKLEKKLEPLATKLDA